MLNQTFEMEFYFRATIVRSSKEAYIYSFYSLTYILLPISRESIVFGSKIQNGDFDGFTRFKVS